MPARLPPAVAPQGESVSNTELFRRLAARFAFTDPAFKRTDEDIARDSLDWTHPSLHGIDLDRLQREGWAKLNLGDADHRLPHAQGEFPTGTGKCEAASTEAAKGSQVLINFRQCYEGEQEGAPLDPVPDYIPVAPADDGQGLSLISPKTHFFLNSCYANFDALSKRSGEQWVLLHPDDAGAGELSEGDWVELSNASGRLSARLRIGTDTLPGVAVVPHGYWRGAGNAHPGSVNSLNPDRPSYIGRAPTFSDTRVTVAKL